MKKRTKKDFVIAALGAGYEYFAFIQHTQLYLLNSGKVINWDVGLGKWGSKGINDKTYFASKQAVNKAIKIYLRRLATRRRAYKIGHIVI